jgi:hypothetical protein
MIHQACEVTHQLVDTPTQDQLARSLSWRKAGIQIPYLCSSNLSIIAFALGHYLDDPKDAGTRKQRQGR